MKIFQCYLWWIVAGLLGGTLLSWLLNWFLSRNGSTGGPQQSLNPVGTPPSGSMTQSPTGYSRQSNGDQIEVIEGIGPKIADVFRSCGISTFTDLANRKPPELREILDKAGPEFDLARTTTWPQQARLLANGDILGFIELTQRLKGGIDPSTK